MRITHALAMTLGVSALAACNQSATEQRADNIEANAEAHADNLEEAADNSSDAKEDRLENQADMVRDQGDAKADVARGETISNAPVKSPDVERTKSAADGANSFTEGQARDRIGNAGFTDVTQLAKDDDGVWRGKAKRGGKSVNVALDYKGNVTSK